MDGGPASAWGWVSIAVAVEAGRLTVVGRGDVRSVCGVWSVILRDAAVRDQSASDIFKKMKIGGKNRFSGFLETQQGLGQSGPLDTNFGQNFRSDRPNWKVRKMINPAPCGESGGFDCRWVPVGASWGRRGREVFRKTTKQTVAEHSAGSPG